MHVKIWFLYYTHNKQINLYLLIFLIYKIYHLNLSVTALTGKPECYTMKLWLPSCPSKTVVDAIIMIVYVATFKQTQDCQEFMCSCKNYKKFSQACDDWLCIHDHCKCVSINKSYKPHCILQSFDSNLSFKVLVCFLLIRCSSLISKLDLLGTCLSVVILILTGM